MVSGDWERALALATVALLAACAPQKPTRDYKVKSYFLRGSFDWDSETLKASEDVTLDLVPFKSSLVERDSKVKVGRVHAGTRTLAWSADESILRVDLSPV